MMGSMAIQQGARAKIGGATPARRRSDRLLAGAGLFALVVGLGLVLSTAVTFYQGYSEQSGLVQTFRKQIADSPPPSAPPEVVKPNLMVPVDGVDFAIRVPRLGYYAAVKEGTDLNVLYSGPGHYSATPWPGQPGNVGVAAHNVYWIRFADLRAGDEVDLETRYGTFKYRVTGTRIVNPDDRTVLVQEPGRKMTLTTCWPLWAGSFATQRYVLFTEQFFPEAAQQVPTNR